MPEFISKRPAPSPKVYDSNPLINPAFEDRYQSAMATYDPSQIEDVWSDRLANWLGFRSHADKLRAELQLQQNEAVNQIINQQAEQEYNSESAKAERMREAGLNPDLQGLGEASEATEGSEPDSRPDFSQLLSGDDFIKSFAGAFTSAISACSSIQGLLSTGIDIRDKIFNYNDRLQSKSWNILRNTNSLDDLRRMFFEDEGFPAYSDSYLKDYGLRSKRDRRFFRQFIATRKGAFEGHLEKYKSFEDYLKAQDDFFTDYSKWYREGFDITPSLRDWSIYTHDVEEAAYKAQEAASKAQKAESEFKQSYAEHLNATDAAAAFNAQQNYAGNYYNTKSGFTQGLSENAVARFNATKTRLQKELYDRLNERSNKGDIFATMLLTHLLAGTNPIGEASSVVDIAKTIGKVL